jgi:hypothetical protein
MFIVEIPINLLKMSLNRFVKNRLGVTRSNFTRSKVFMNFGTRSKVSIFSRSKV